MNTSGVWPGARNAVADLSYDAGVPPYSHDTGEKSETAIRSLYSDQINPLKSVFESEVSK